MAEAEARIAELEHQVAVLSLVNFKEYLSERDRIEKLEKDIKLDNDTTGPSVSETSNDISEVYSPPRIAARAARHGLRPGFSLDLIGSLCMDVGRRATRVIRRCELLFWS